LKPLKLGFITLKNDRLDFPHKVPMVVSMGIVETQAQAIITGVNGMVYIGQAG
jgi:hypothetical protein